ncbi:uncharacterized protein LOC121988974 isoform X1 [Zingiber officinale]|uniref:uncharacterized protein LOC121988974 isoform X1 n=1 Tax=Zingiber officinale TaxID=94328 RepID=UPI001C4CEB35|nr:uncharacterized protein LOC121988974 isoform X1 [Zingiber officinale]
MEGPEGSSREAPRWYLRRGDDTAAFLQVFVFSSGRLRSHLLRRFDYIQKQHSEILKWNHNPWPTAAAQQTRLLQIQTSNWRQIRLRTTQQRPLNCLYIRLYAHATVCFLFLAAAGSYIYRWRP